jgi:hypothetical protein
MKKNLAYIVLFLLTFAAGLFAGNPTAFYRIQPVSSNEVDIACVHGEPQTSMRLDGLLEVYCHVPPK